MPIIDLHCDTIDRIFQEKSDLFMNDYHVDLHKLKKGDYLAQWFALFIDSKSAQKPLMTVIQEMYDYFINQITRHQDHMMLAADWKTYCEAKDNGKIAAFLSVEEGQVIEDKLENIEKLSNLGIRMMTFTWNYENALGGPHWSTAGLTELGKQATIYLNHTPILADISHLSDTAVRELVTLYKKPVIASHCNARTVCNHTRNLSDEVIRKIADSGGVMGINLYGLFVNGTHDSTLKDLETHIHHIYQIGGEDLIALGTDFDGMNCNLEVCNAAEMGKLIDRLSKIYPQSFIDKFTYKNVERIIRENL